MKTNTKKATTKAVESKAKIEDDPKKYSKTWLAALANKGTGKIIDMRAVLK